MRKIILTTLLLGSVYANAQDIDGEVHKLHVANGKLFAGGIYEKAARRVVNNIAAFDGSAWSGLAKGVDGKVEAIANIGTNLYVAGDFTFVDKTDDKSVESPKIARWDGTKWISMNPTVDRSIFSLAVSGNNLYVGGNFKKVANTIDCAGVAMYDGKKWSSVGGAKFDKTVLALATVGNNLYAGGFFTLVGDEPAQSIAKWDGKTWKELGNAGLDQQVSCLASDGTTLYIGGDFNADGKGNPIRKFAKSDGTKIEEVGGGVEGGKVKSIFVDGNKVYIAGTFGSVGNGKKPIPAAGIAMWDGNKWTTYPEINNATINSVAVYNGTVYIGATFESGALQGVAKFENGKWVTVTK